MQKTTKILITSGLVMGIILGGCGMQQNTEQKIGQNNTQTKQQVNKEDVTISKNINQNNKTENVLSNYLKKEEIAQLKYELENNKAKLGLVSQFGEKIRKICTNYDNLDQLLTKDKQKFTDLINIYQQIIDGVPAYTIAKINKTLDQIIGRECYKNWDMSNMERLAEQVRRGDYTTWKEKLQRTQKYWDLYVVQDIKTDLKFIEDLKKQCKNNTQCVKQKFIESCTKVDSFNPFYNIMHNRYNWNKVSSAGLWFKPKVLETQFIDKLIEAFNNVVLKAAGLTPEEFKDAIRKHYGFNNTDELVNLIVQKFLELKKEAGLENYIPVDRKFTKKERKKIFKSRQTFDQELKGLVDNPEFKSKIKEIRLLVYYLIYFDDSKKFWSSGYRSKNMKYGYGIQNLFRVSRYIDEPFKLELRTE